MATKYDSIIELPHHSSVTRPRMPLEARAAQFAPFAALTGFGAAIAETGRLTQRRRELDEDEKAAINAVLSEIQARLPQQSKALICYFLPDERKTGGSYVTAEGFVKKLDELQRRVLLVSGESIPIDDICAVELKDK